MAHPRLVPDNTKIPFFRYRWIAFGWSILVLVATILLVTFKGLNYGIDFSGGVLLEVRSEAAADLPLMRSTLATLDLGDVSLQTAGADNQVMIRAKAPEGDEAAQRQTVERIKAALDQAVGTPLTYQRAEFVGPRVSQELLMNSVWAVLVSLLGVLLYLWFRFEWQYGLGAIASLVHDVSASIGIYAVTGLEFNLTSIAALLTIVGYSLNDTVVIYDRVRENLRRFKTMPLEQLLDRSINETLARTLATSLTTMLALAALYFFGGEVISGFTIIMLWGVIIGTYSTIYIATPVLYYLNLRAPAVDAGKTGAAPAEAAAGAAPAAKTAAAATTARASAKKGGAAAAPAAKDGKRPPSAGGSGRSTEPAPS